MALYDGFFDAIAVKDESGNETGEYDRAYGPSDFTNYYSNIIGSGVCVHNNPDSFKAEFEGDKLYLRMGYLFIQGYWLANVPDEDEDPATFKGYEVTLPGSGTYAVVAHLNLGQRMIEIETRSVAQAYPDALVLAIVSPTSAEDTRYNTDICGIIDTAGELSSKVEWAINYIDNEIENKLAAAEQTIAAQELRLDAKIAEVQAQVSKIVPPPIGTIKFSASQNVDEKWLQCDGSFINEADYPELVAALGKLTPGVEDFEEVSGGAHQGTFSNGVLDSGILWTFSQTENKLIGYVLADKTVISIPTTGTDTLVSSIANSIVLSICDDHVFLTQNQGSAVSFILLEATGFAKTSTSLEFEALPVASKLSSYLTNAVPEVVKVKEGSEDKFFMCYGRSKGALSTGMSDNVAIAAQCLKWVVDDFSTATASTVELTPITNGTNRYCMPYVDTLFRYNRKNSRELFTLYVAGDFGNSKSNVTVKSRELGVYNSSGATDYNILQISTPTTLVSPVAGNNVYIYSCAISNKKMTLRAGKISPNEPFTKESSETPLSVTLPSAAKLFQDSICFCGSQALWVIFVGTGFVFSKNPLSHEAWGYLNTSDVLGVITQFGCVDFDDDKQILCISGRDTTNRLRVGFLKFDDIYNYANDGAWLPMIASDGVPAYIKAKEDESGGNNETVPMQITVLQPVGAFNTYASVTFNDESLITGTYTRNVDPNGTFTVGVYAKVYSRPDTMSVKMNGVVVTSYGTAYAPGTSKETFNVADFINDGITLQGIVGT